MKFDASLLNLYEQLEINKPLSPYQQALAISKDIQKDPDAAKDPNAQKLINTKKQISAETVGILNKIHDNLRKVSLSVKPINTI